MTIKRQGKDGKVHFLYALYAKRISVLDMKNTLSPLGNTLRTVQEKEFFSFRRLSIVK